jgi:iron(III) transport system ATP-binding protein
VTALLELDHVSFAIHSRPIVRDVSLSLERGEVVAFVGPSGSGKTSLLRLLLGLVAPTHGFVRIDGAVASTPGRVLLPAADRGFGAVFQDLALWPHLSVGENLAFALSVRRVPQHDRERRVVRMLERVGLGDAGDRRPTTLSGGEQQRVALARALVPNPRLVALDEPFANVDLLLRDDLVELVRALVRESGAAAILVTHDPSEAVRMATRVVVLEAGKIVQIGTVDELDAEPGSAFVRAFAARMRAAQ